MATARHQSAGSRRNTFSVRTLRSGACGSRLRCTWSAVAIFGFNLSDPFDSHVYIVDGGGGELAMIDTGTGLGEEEIIANMHADGLKAESIKYVFVTHGHLDHAGGAAGIRTRFGAQVLAAPRTADFLRRGDEDAISLTAARKAGMYPAEYRLQPTPVDGELHDGDIVSIGSLDVEGARDAWTLRGPCMFRAQ